MERGKRLTVMGILSLLTLAGFFLRRISIAAPLAWGSLTVVILLAVCVFLLPRNKTYGTVDGKGAVLLLLSLAAAGMALVCALLRLKSGEGKGLALMLAATALCWSVTAFLRQRGKKVSPWLLMLPAVFFGAELVAEFRFWGSDPRILDYCYELLALIATMCATFHLSGFCFDKGQRRLTGFFAMAGVYFNGIALADAVGGEALLKLGCVAWLLVNLCLLLRPVKE